MQWGGGSVPAEILESDVLCKAGGGVGRYRSVLFGWCRSQCRCWQRLYKVLCGGAVAGCR